MAATSICTAALCSTRVLIWGKQKLSFCPNVLSFFIGGTNEAAVFFPLSLSFLKVFRDSNCFLPPFALPTLVLALSREG